MTLTQDSVPHPQQVSNVPHIIWLLLSKLQAFLIARLPNQQQPEIDAAFKGSASNEF